LRKNSNGASGADGLTCREFVELVTDYLEDALPPEVRARVQAHVDVCDGCRLYLGQMRLTIRALHQKPEGSLPAQLRAAILKQFRDT
jgi:hypothetical protein